MFTSVNRSGAKKDLKTRNRILLLRAGIRDVTELARRIGKSRPWTSNVLYGHIKSPATRNAIAETLGIPVEKLWPRGRKQAA